MNREIKTRPDKYGAQPKSGAKKQDPKEDPKNEKEEKSQETPEDDMSDFRKEDRKTFTLVRIEDDIVEDFREIVRIFKLKSHGPLMNKVLRDYAKLKLNGNS